MLHLNRKAREDVIILAHQHMFSLGDEINPTSSSHGNTQSQTGRCDLPFQQGSVKLQQSYGYRVDVYWKGDKFLFQCLK